jgi:plastocyanin
VNVNLSATDGGAGVDVTEYRVDGGEWQTARNTAGADPFNTSVAVTDGGAHTVDYRSIDKAMNEEETKSVSFSIRLPECERSDEFDGTALGARWLRHDRNGGTPTTGAMAPRLEGGQLIMPTHNFELDGNNVTTATGPVNFVGQSLPALGDSWEVETQFTIQHTGGWQHAGLIVWQGDNNFFRSTITNSLDGGHIYVEQSKDNPPSAEGARVQSGNTTILPTAQRNQPVTIRMRYARAAGSDTVTTQYRVVAPASVANADWVNFPTNANWNNSGGASLAPAGGPRRDSAGSRIGLLAAGNFPNNTGPYQYNGTPAEMKVDYFRVTPDVCPEPDATKPVTSALINGAAPTETYTGPVNVTLSATDEPAAGDPFLGSAARVFAGALAEHDVFAAGNSWNPTEVDAVLGDVVTWHFDDPGPSHDVWVIAPDEAPDSTGTEVTDGAVPGGGPPVSFTPDQEGEWTYVCKLHSFPSGGRWTGMVGTIDVTDSGEPGPVEAVTGVDRTEYRVDGGAWVTSANAANVDPFVTTFSVGGNGDHTVEYRSVDGAGNMEAPKSVSFRIQSTQQSSGGGTQSGGGATPAPDTEPFVGLSRPPKTSLAQFRKRGLKIRVTCNKAMSGRAVLQITGKTRRKLKLTSTTLASRAVRCTQPGSKSVTLKPAKKVRRALGKARGTVKVTLVVRMAATGESPTRVTRKLSLKRR